ncbi:MAG: hypothetical protein M0P13_10335 [Fibrobacteraceae bacterium]|nr:hypothetical protein [Fibrobacteraceae bacterium]
MVKFKDKYAEFLADGHGTVIYSGVNADSFQRARYPNFKGIQNLFKSGGAPFRLNFSVSSRC